MRRADALEQRLEAEHQAAIAKAVNEFLNDDLLAAVAPQVRGRDVTVRGVLDKASEAIEGKFEDEALLEVTVQRARRSLPDGRWLTSVFLRKHGVCLTVLNRSLKKYVGQAFQPVELPKDPEKTGWKAGPTIGSSSSTAC